MAILAQETVRIPAAVAAAMVAHARAGKPEEICGIVRGRGLVAFEAIRGQNVAQDRVNNYDVDPQTLLRQFKFEEQGDEMMGIYHSHPISVAYPSATDASNAYYPECIYFICSLEDDQAPVTRAFRMITHFLEIDPVALRRELAFYETRPGLFAYYQSLETTPPPVVDALLGQIERPFYLVCYEEAGESTDLRAVSLVEYPIEIQD